MQVAALKDAGEEAGEWPKDLDARVHSIQVPAWFPEALLKLIQCCMCLDPANRYTMAVVADFLERFAAITPEAGADAQGWY